MLGFGVLGTIILGTETSSVSATVTLTAAAAATAVAAAIAINVMPGATGINATGAVAAFASNAITAPFTGTNSTGAAQPVTIQEISNVLTGVFGSGALSGIAAVIISPTINSGVATAQVGSQAIVETVGFTGVNSSGVAPSITPDVEPLLSGRNGSGLAATIAAIPSPTPSGVFGSGAVNTFGILELVGAGTFSTGTPGIISAQGIQPVNLAGINGTGLVGGVAIIEADTLIAVFGSAVAASAIQTDLVAINGVNAQGQVNAVTAPVLPTFTGVNATGNFSALHIEIDVSLGGVSGTGFTDVFVGSRAPTAISAIATGAVTALTPEVDVALVGSSATSAATDFNRSPTMVPAIGTGAPGTWSVIIGPAGAGINATGAVNNFTPEIDVQTVTGIFGSGQAQAITGDPSPYMVDVFATGISPNFIPEVDVPLPSVFVTGLASVQFGPNGFFDGVEAGTGVGQIIPTEGALTSVQATAVFNSLVNAEVDVSPSLDTFASGATNSFGISETGSFFQTVTAVAVAGIGLALPQKFVIISGTSTGVASNAFATIVSSLAVGAQGVAESFILTFANSVEINGISASAFANAGIIPAFGVHASGVAGVRALSAASSLAGSTTNPMFDVFAIGSALNFVPTNIITDLFGTFADGQAFNFGESGVAIQDATAIVGAAGTLSGEPETFALVAATASGGAGILSKAILLGGVSAQGESQQITQFVLGDSPTLTGAFAQGLTDTFSILPTLTGIQASAIAALLSPNRTLASAVAQAESGALPFLYSVMVGVTAIGGTTATVVLIVSFNVNNAITIHGVASKNLPPA